MFEFNQDEIAEKKRRIHSLLEQRNLSAVYLKKSSNFAWVTAGGYSIVGLGTEVGIAGVLRTRNKEYVICNNIETLRLEREEGVVRQGYEIVSFPWNEDREAKIVADLAGGAVGADMGFPGATDVSSAINPLRYSLTPWEVERLKVQALETSRIAEETALGIRPGEEERAVVGRLSEKLWKAGMDFIVAFCAADERIGLYRHAIATDKKIEKRAMISVNSRKRGLIVSITRFVQFGKLPADLAKRYEDNVYVDSAMMAATIPGRPASEVFAAALKDLRRKGLSRGISAPSPGWVHRVFRQGLQGDGGYQGYYSGKPGIYLEPVDYRGEERRYDARHQRRSYCAFHAGALPGV
jgi:Xaa-Pro aminopeptidase